MVSDKATGFKVGDKAAAHKAAEKSKKDGKDDAKDDDEEFDDDDRPLSQKQKAEEEAADDDGEDDGDGDQEKKNVRRDRRSRERRRRDRDRKRREEKKAQESGQKTKVQVVDDAILDKYDPHECMEVYSWPMPLPEDAGRVRAYGVQGQVHEFWEYYEEYFKPITTEAVKRHLKEPDLDHDSCFRMPPLGPLYSTNKKWGAKDDPPHAWETDNFGLHDNDDDVFAQKAMVTSSGRVVGGKRKTAEPPSAPPGGWGVEPPSAPGDPTSSILGMKMVMRMLACFVQQDGVPSAADAMKEAADVVQAVTDQSPDLTSFSVEQRMRTELANLGLMEHAEVEYDLPYLREDDQICAELRYQQKALRRHVQEREKASTASRKALLMKLEANSSQEVIMSDVLKAAQGLESLLQPKLKFAKGVKPHDIKQKFDIWDEAMLRYKAFLANPRLRKPGASGSLVPGKKSGDSHASGSSGKVLGNRPLQAGGKMVSPTQGAAAASKVAQFHSSLHRR